MPINNLHSLLSSPWYITQSYAEAHLPFLINLLDGKSIAVENTTIESLSASTPSGVSMFYDDIEDDTTEKYVVVMSIKSPIYKYDQMCGPRGTKSRIAMLDRLKSDDKIAGILLDIDSGGGQVYGTPEFHDYLTSYPKPIVTYTDGLMASAAYYIGASADYIIANKRADAIGSIGAYTQVLDVSGYLEKQGAKLHTVYSSKSEEKNQAYRELIKGNYGLYISEELDPLADTFINDIKTARPNINEKVFKGATYNTSTSLDLGLIDELGTMQTAIDKVFELSNTQTNITNTEETMATTATERERLQTVLGLESPLASTDNGSYLNDDQLNAIEAHIESQETAVQNAQTETTQATTNATNAQATVTAINTALDAAIEASEINVEANATASEKITALQSHIASLGKQPGATHTTANTGEEEGESHSYVDFNASIYKNK